MAENQTTGNWGEDLACETLIKAGYAIMARNWRSNHHEIDIVAQKGARIVFVEVKTRSNIEDDPSEAMTRKKQQFLIRAANAYIRMYNISLEAQFDYIGISGTPNNYEIEHIPDAFFPTLKTYR